MRLGTVLLGRSGLEQDTLRRTRWGGRKSEVREDLPCHVAGFDLRDDPTLAAARTEQHRDAKDPAQEGSPIHRGALAADLARELDDRLRYDEFPPWVIRSELLWASSRPTYASFTVARNLSASGPVAIASSGVRDVLSHRCSS